MTLAPGGRGALTYRDPDRCAGVPTAARVTLLEGPFVLVYEMLFGVRTTVTIPAPDWHGLQYLTIVEKHGMAGPPQGAGLVVYGGDMLVYADPCAWESTRPDDAPASLDELVAALGPGLAGRHPCLAT